MPVWHRETKALRESGRLTVIGITQEQHPDRCRLFARWQGLDWPILWDPFNMTGSAAVPRATLIDEHGIVRALRFDPGTVKQTFLDVSFPKPASDPAPTKDAEHALVEATTAKKGSPEAAYYGALSTLLWPAAKTDWSAIDHLAKYAQAHAEDAAAWWRLGVAERMRHDSPARTPADFANALRHWGRGLALNPRQYIYRRRIQQYGPRLDKPYPFYDWVGKAQAALEQGGEAPGPLSARLSGAEVADRRVSGISMAETEPDPEGRIQNDGGLLTAESAVAWHTGPRKGDAARVHLRLRPAAAGKFEWDMEAGPVQVWLVLPDGWKTERRLLAHAGTPRADRDDSVAFDFEVAFVGRRGQSGAVRGYALYYGCLDGSGECTYLRHEFEIPVRRTVESR